ncbi:GH3 auxin-responsive promoter family protein [Rubinisphaera margarita]|uniref:GH3 auxin-responsive promoter family protein n=1 Tax=Rubinisphaera margarita TaxID=2909586 RepID=UPI001EE8B228|nr:GH3 auxin-responsive promoter family protein [Rubinisphaera margarita]MCG6157120.1 GH3 auxin-responsive promoter family protein [Rubinisphaera margarita]
MFSQLISAHIPTALRPGLQLANSWQFGQFHKKLLNAPQQQQDWLMRRIRGCRETGFGRDHGFAEIRTLEDFRRQVPVSEYAYFAPYIDAVAAGRTEALVPAHEKLQRFTITTGSSGTPKLNPVTNVWLKELKQAWAIWGMKYFADHPTHIGDKVLQMAGIWEMGKTSGGYSISMVSALLARVQNPLLRPFYAVPSDLNDIKDPEVRYYTALRLTITERIGWILLMNPGTLIRLAEIGDQYKEDLIRDLRDGTLSERFDIPRSLRALLARRTERPNALAAQQLEAIVNQTGRLLPRDYWNKPVISCWLGGTAGYQSRYLHEYFGDSPLRDMGLVSSEGRHTIPIEDTEPRGVPSLTSGFYEYVPVEEAGKPHPDVVEGHELIEGQDYYLLMTTSAGYYRFSIGDIVRCRGFVGKAPLLEFIQKGTRVGDLEGEKLTEHQIIEAAHDTAADLGIELGLFTAVARRLEHQHPRYDFLVEVDSLPDAGLAQRFLQLLDEKLEGKNFLWRARRREGVLANPNLIRLPSGRWEQYIAEEVERRGTGDFQYKHPGLVLDGSWVDQFTPVDIIPLKSN